MVNVADYSNFFENNVLTMIILIIMIFFKQMIIIVSIAKYIDCFFLHVMTFLMPCMIF